MQNHFLFGRKAIAIATLASLAACGGGGDSSPSAPVAGPVTPTAPVTPAPDPPTLQLQLPDLSGLPAQAAAAFALINEARLRYGQGVLNPDPLLQKAAQDHANWIANAESIPEGAHYQVPGTPGFTGYAPWDRIRNAGYIAYNSSEVLSAISENKRFETQEAANAAKKSGQGLMTPRELGESFVKSQLNSVYHRFGILGPWRDAGYGSSYYTKSSVSTLGDFGVSSVMGFSLGCKSQCQHVKPPYLLVYPTPDSVAEGFLFGNEVPHPAPDMGIGARFGYPVTIEAGGPITEISVFEMRRPSGELVNSRMHTQANDPAKYLKSHQAFLLPMDPLEPNTKYTIKLELKISGVAQSKTWAFTTPAKNE